MQIGMKPRNPHALYHNLRWSWDGDGFARLVDNQSLVSFYVVPILTQIEWDADRGLSRRLDLLLIAITKWLPHHTVSGNEMWEGLHWAQNVLYYYIQKIVSLLLSYSQNLLCLCYVCLHITHFCSGTHG